MKKIILRWAYMLAWVKRFATGEAYETDELVSMSPGLFHLSDCHGVLMWRPTC